MGESGEVERKRKPRGKLDISFCSESLTFQHDTNLAGLGIFGIPRVMLLQKEKKGQKTGRGRVDLECRWGARGKGAWEAGRPSFH